MTEEKLFLDLPTPEDICMVIGDIDFHTSQHPAQCDCRYCLSRKRVKAWLLSVAQSMAGE